MTSNY